MSIQADKTVSPQIKSNYEVEVEKEKKRDKLRTAGAIIVYLALGALGITFLTGHLGVHLVPGKIGNSCAGILGAGCGYFIFKKMRSYRSKYKVYYSAKKAIKEFRKYGSRITLAQCHPDLRKNFYVVMAAVQRDGYNLAFASPELKKDSKIVLAAVRQHPNALDFADPQFKELKHWNISLAMVRHQANHYVFLDDSLKNHPLFQDQAFRINPEVIEYMKDME